MNDYSNCKYEVKKSQIENWRDCTKYLINYLLVEKKENFKYVPMVDVAYFSELKDLIIEMENNQSEYVLEFSKNLKDKRNNCMEE